MKEAIKEREKELFKKVIEFYKKNVDIQTIGSLLLNSLNEINENSNITQEDKLFKVKIVLTLGKIYLKVNYRLKELIEIIENELKINFHVALVALLYRCYYYKTIQKEKEIKSNQQFKQSSMYSLHARTSELISLAEKENISDISMSKYSFVQSKFKFTNEGGVDYDIKLESDIFCALYGKGISIQLKIPINLISCGRYFIMALDSNGLVWNWGRTYEPLSKGQCEPSYPHSLKKTIKSIAAGFHHCLALADDGSVYGWGSNSFGCLGGITPDGSFIPEMTQLNFNEKMIKIEAGGFNSAFISATGKLSVLGRNNRLQLGFETIPTLFPNIDTSKVKSQFLPEISVSPSTIPQDFAVYIANEEFSDIQILFKFDNNESPEIVNIHSVLFLSQLSNNNPTLIENIRKLKQESNSDGKVSISFEKFLEFSSKSQSDIDIIKFILEQPVEDQMNQFLDFVSFLYTNSASKRYSKVLSDYYSKLFKCKQLKHFMDQSFRYIPEDCDLLIPDNLHSFAYNNKDFFSDCIITNGSINLYCHKVILSSRLKSLKPLILNSSKQEDSLVKINFPDVVSDSELILMISYLYSDRIKLVSIPSKEITGNFILELYKNSYIHLFNRFGEGLLKLVSQSVTKENANQLLKWSEINSGCSNLTHYINAFLGNEFAPQYSDCGREGLYKPSCPLPHVNVVDVSVGQKLMIVLTDDNKIYQLGYGSDSTKSHINLITLPDPDSNSKIIKISCGSSHGLVLTESFKAYGWGCGLEGQIVKNTRKMYTEPILLYDAKYNNMKAGFYSALFWNDLSTFPLNLTNGNNNGNNDVSSSSSSSSSSSNSNSNIDKDLLKEFDKLKINSNDQVQINIYNFEDENRLWYFKQFKSFKDNFTISNSEDNNKQPNVSSIKTSVSNLPPLLIQKYLDNKNSNASNNEITIFGFSKESVELLLSIKNNYTENLKIVESIKSGDQLMDLLFLSTSLGDLKTSELLFHHFKKSLTLEDSILLLACIYESNYSIQLSFLFNYLLGVLNLKKLEILKNDSLLNLVPKHLLDVLLNNILEKYTKNTKS